MLNNLLFILGIIALSNGNISLGDSIKENITESEVEVPNINGKSRGIKKDNRLKIKSKLRPKKNNNIVQEYEEVEEDIDNEEVEEVEEIREDSMKFNLNDISKGLKMLDLSDEDLDRG
ncbi:MAG: hypothetical protein ACRC1Y_03780, partial [Paraclostridium sp.]